MRFCRFFYPLLLLLLTACNKEDLCTRVEGTYKGRFERVYTNTNNPIASNVTLYFSQGNFSGTSGAARLPALCSGSYRLQKGEMQLVNSCPFTADFDWTLIFNGRYKYEKEGSQLRIWREYADGTRDLYVLEKKPE